MNRLNILLLLAILAVGCSASENRFVGKWNSDVALDAAKGDQPGDRLLKGIGAFAQAVGPRIDFRSDHTFTLIILFTIEGTWKADGNIVTCTPMTVSGVKIDNLKNRSTTKDASGAMAKEYRQTDDPTETFRLKISDDGKSLTSADDAKPDWSLKREETQPTK